MARKLKAPQVVGEIIAGLIIGPSILGWVNQTDFLLQMAEIGVIFLMFSAGLETNMRDLLKTGPIATLIACSGVFIPLFMGAGFYMLYYGASPWGSEETQGIVSLQYCPHQSPCQRGSLKAQPEFCLP